MYKPVYFLLLVLFFGIASCDKKDDTESFDPDNLLLGTWVNSEFNEIHYTMERASEFSEDYDGFKFRADGTFVSRANCGFCGTPPISYCNYEGTWEKSSEDMLYIKIEDWSGERDFIIEIISVSETLIEFNYVIAEN